ncbi:hypothetical protein PsAD46_00750 [Pseudovibrio sp. Ad46]|uniref:hypothetical protein n=1 Tax=unclassified Pseudovibrio TaxID=2627060 RepID=UPI0007AEBFAF|nr:MULTISPECIES: hypothetical protein [unclassified Pseudovibrio]KZK95735.1 hypothetical protein PsAD46_00750 [Pseudovibrio sp. Ad46]KZL00205.1 hypothetical protein PsW74_02625 [Pseudovibrio sp. W74]KZL11603.1 hypothetical protein PsAD14_00753 [Pseudovibrio sp. Ad14]
MDIITISPLDGLQSYVNLMAYNASQELVGTSEFNLYSDAQLIGTLNDGLPFSFLNLVPGYATFGNIRPAAVLRVNWYAEAADLPKISFTHTSDQEYHAGTMQDELAALASLRLGVRLKAGSEVRSFGWNDHDPMGTPQPERTAIPSVQQGTLQPIAPFVLQPAQLCDLKILNRLKSLSREKYSSLVKSARLFQDALWILESAPEQAWLMLTSALETAAVFHQTGKLKSVDAFKVAQPEITEFIKENSSNKVFSEIAKALGGSQKATKKFLDFTALFKPEPPEKRPYERFQLDFSERHFSDTMKAIYKYRSLALHDGKPFPAPMCSPPFQHQEWDAPAEVGTIGLSMSTQGATWASKDLPICLNFFVYIVQATLNNWWTSMVDKETCSA